MPSVKKNTAPAAAEPTAGQKAAATKAAAKAAAPATPEVKAKPAAKAVAKPSAVVPAAAKTATPAKKAAPVKPAAKPVAKPAAKAAPVKEAAEGAGEGDDGDVDEVGSPMSRKDLADALRGKVVAQGFGLSPKVAMAVVESYEEAIKDAVAAGRMVVLSGFGKFKTTLRAAGKARNPQTGAEVDRAAAWAVSFRPAKGLKEAAASRPTE